MRAKIEAERLESKTKNIYDTVNFLRNLQPLITSLNDIQAQLKNSSIQPTHAELRASKETLDQKFESISPHSAIIEIDEFLEESYNIISMIYECNKSANFFYKIKDFKNARELWQQFDKIDSCYRLILHSQKNFVQLKAKYTQLLTPLIAGNLAEFLRDEAQDKSNNIGYKYQKINIALKDFKKTFESEITRFIDNLHNFLDSQLQLQKHQQEAKKLFKELGFTHLKAEFNEQDFTLQSEYSAQSYISELVKENKFNDIIQKYQSSKNKPLATDFLTSALARSELNDAIFIMQNYALFCNSKISKEELQQQYKQDYDRMLAEMTINLAKADYEADVIYDNYQEYLNIEQNKVIEFAQTRQRKQIFGNDESLTAEASLELFNKYSKNRKDKLYINEQIDTTNQTYKSATRSSLGFVEITQFPSNFFTNLTIAW